MQEVAIIDILSIGYHGHHGHPESWVSDSDNTDHMAKYIHTFRKQQKVFAFIF